MTFSLFALEGVFLFFLFWQLATVAAHCQYVYHRFGKPTDLSGLWFLGISFPRVFLSYGETAPSRSAKFQAAQVLHSRQSFEPPRRVLAALRGPALCDQRLRAGQGVGGGGGARGVRRIGSGVQIVVSEVRIYGTALPGPPPPPPPPMVMGQTSTPPPPVVVVLWLGCGGLGLVRIGLGYIYGVFLVSLGLA